MPSFDTFQDAYRDFRNIVAENTNGIVAWVGAGLSAVAGVPTWRDLHQLLCNSLERKIRTLARDDQPILLGQLKAANAEPNLWVAFEILRNALGLATYRQVIRDALSPADTAAVPQAYLSLWRLRLAGVLNLNLDRLATRAHSEVLPGRKLNEFLGKDAGPNLHLMKAAHPFVANLHGVTENVDSWVLTRAELRKLLRKDGYLQLIASCLSSRTILFVGLSAEDVAAGGHLERLAKNDVHLGSHYWITHRTDAATDRWAEKTGIRVIRYRARNSDHSELLEFFDDLLHYVPLEKDAIPVTANLHSDNEELPEPTQLERQDAESIRTILNSAATRILSAGDPDKYQMYEQFCKKYEEAIYRAWFVSTTAPKNRLLGYQVLDRVAKGAFGTVYRATDETGQQLAIKLLHEEIRTQPDMLQNFRRGVASMEILSRHRLDGVVSYRQASEIPACVIMDYVEGPSLQEAVLTRRISDWHTALRIAVTLATIIRRSHQLPERVLHRDIRPSNVMLRNGWSNQEQDWEVVVLDFDLSWHRDARELSVMTTETLNGYIAPEQVERTSKVSTRNALVDSYGFGMTLFFLKTGTAPQVMQPRYTNWREILNRSAQDNASQDWHSAPKRFFRLVYHATRPHQKERWDMSQILGELERLKAAVDSPGSVVSSELLAEELAFRGLGADYEWDEDSSTATIQLPTGVHVAITGDESKRRIGLEAEWMQRGGAHYSNVAKWLPKAYEKAYSILTRCGWHVYGGTTGGQTVGVGAYCDSNSLAKNLRLSANAVRSVLEALTFAG